MKYNSISSIIGHGFYTTLHSPPEASQLVFTIKLLLLTNNRCNIIKHESDSIKSNAKTEYSLASAQKSQVLFQNAREKGRTTTGLLTFAEISDLTCTHAYTCENT